MVGSGDAFGQNITNLFKMRKLVNKLFSVTIFLFMSLTTFGQRGIDYDDTEEYDWTEFNPTEFFIAAIVCAIVIVIGMLLRKNSNNKIISGIGTTIIVLGGLGAVGFLGGPILGAIQIIWQVLIGSAVFFGIIYWVYKKYIDE